MIYLDNSATTKPDPSVMETFTAASMRYFANPASLHAAGREAETLLNRSKEQMLQLTGSTDGEAILTSGGTEANNLAIFGFAEACKHRGRHIITTEIEHPSVYEACRRLTEDGYEVEYLSVDENGVISIEELSQALRPDTILVSIMHVNNEIGSVQPIEEAAKVIKEKTRACFHSDCVQSYGKLPISLNENQAGPDAVTISAHKLNGLKNSGVLLCKKGYIPAAVTYGGGQEKGIRSGTVSVPHAAALAKAMRIYSPDIQKWNKYRGQIQSFCDQNSHIRFLSKSAAPHIASLAFEGVTGEVAVNFFQEKGIIVSTSSACSSKSSKAGRVIEAIHLPQPLQQGVIRISFGTDTKEEEIAKLLNRMHEFMELLKRGVHHGVE